MKNPQNTRHIVLAIARKILLYHLGYKLTPYCVMTLLCYLQRFIL